jgi:hypothetical protein
MQSSHRPSPAEEIPAGALNERIVRRKPTAQKSTDIQSRPLAEMEKKQMGGTSYVVE